ncbi:ribosome-associated heat shock protein Hsp15 [Endozoicomonas sp. G2_1]|uniref:ribosome-associated heat shock protein Hsp15 n=1 Tax=Endozoicomonas sp. G2_1 TaxID=2821091 RepID=UPI001ADB3E01|nr:ribosome-associated heat shock protein Hsp15 [Endozoicomonas sp. G2_1]MBO9491892.1 ribosome-associated heat shock protein Hsp15 [Endozoicomonas sp. G2_1]
MANKKSPVVKSSSENDKNSGVRLDKWLWAARFYKTRALAKQMIDGGKVFYNGQRSKSGKLVSIGDKIRVRQGYEEKEVLIVALADKRRDATFAQTLYQETEASIKVREDNALARKQGILLSPASETKPDKKQRRQIRQFKERV